MLPIVFQSVIDDIPIGCARLKGTIALCVPEELWMVEEAASTIQRSECLHVVFSRAFTKFQSNCEEFQTWLLSNVSIMKQ